MISDTTRKDSTLDKALLAVQRLQARVAELEATAHEPIAVIGMACRFSGGVDDPESFWQLLSKGIDTIQPIPDDRWEGTPSGDFPRWAGLLSRDTVQTFDAPFFGITPREAKSLDPQQRLLLEASWEALERAGQAPEKLVGSPTGVFFGLSFQDYAQRFLQFRSEDLDAYHCTGNMPSIAAGRVSYVLGLQGPCMTVDTACSSSLVAVHLAVGSLRKRECDLALAGGVNLILSPSTMEGLACTKALSPSGRCKTFDARADGYVRGEGCGVIALKRLSQAEKDGDTILAVIRGSAINQDGRSTGLTAPNVLSQQQLLQSALKDARIPADSIGYMEAHGTGTPLGDPIEVQALKSIYGESRSDGSHCYLSSVKTNIGHTESAAGIAGLIKVVLALQHEMIPRHLNFDTLNPRIELDGTPFVIPTDPQPWKRGGKPRRGAVSSFGMSGTNSHVILEEAPPAPQPTPALTRPAHVLALSGIDRGALHDLAVRYATFLEQHPGVSLGDVCHTAGAARSHFRTRLAVVATSHEQTARDLQAFAAGRPAQGVASGEFETPPRVAFLFTGQGSQYVGMGRTLYDTQPVFKESLDRCAEILQAHLTQPLLAVLYPADGAASPLDETQFTQPALFALEYSLAQLWLSWGITPSAVMGHSVGELVAACVAGAFNLEDALSLVAARGRLMQKLSEPGAMVSTRATEAQVRDLLGDYPRVSIAAINGPQSVVVSGAEAEVLALAAKLEAAGIETKRLTVSHAFHSPLMEPILEDFRRVAAAVRYMQPTLTLISNLTGQAATDEVMSADYWVRHVREAVRFADGVQALAKLGLDACVEVGPQPVLAGLGAACLPEGGPRWLPSLRRGKEDWSMLLESVAQLYCLGQAIDWDAFDRPYGLRRVPAPTYPFQRKRYWVESAVTGKEAMPTPAMPEPDKAAASNGTHGNGATVAETLVSRLQAMDPQAAREHLIAAVQEKVTWVARLDGPEQVPPTRPLWELGMDSLMVAELGKAIIALVGRPLPATLPLTHPTVEKMVNYILKELKLDAQRA